MGYDSGKLTITIDKRWSYNIRTLPEETQFSEIVPVMAWNQPYLPPGATGGGLLPGQTAVDQPPLGKGQWISASDGYIPPHAVSGGFDAGNEVFVARAFFNGGLIPGKLVHGHSSCYIAWGGKEHSCPNYEVLCHPEGGTWVSSDSFPFDAVFGGNTEHGELLYVGRVLHGNSAAVGKIQKSHGVCYFSFAGNELSSNDYEILVLN